MWSSLLVIMRPKAAWLRGKRREPRTLGAARFPEGGALPPQQEGRLLSGTDITQLISYQGRGHRGALEKTLPQLRG